MLGYRKYNVQAARTRERARELLPSGLREQLFLFFNRALPLSRATLMRSSIQRSTVSFPYSLGHRAYYDHSRWICIQVGFQAFPRRRNCVLVVYIERWLMENSSFVPSNLNDTSY